LLEDVDDEAVVTLGSNFIRMSTPEMCFTSKLIDGRFPEYQNVLPMSGEHVLTCDRELLRQALHRVSILSNEKYRGVRMALSEGLLDPMNIGFNVNYLLDAVVACEGDEVQIHFSDPNSCCLIRAVEGERCKYVVMPMRL